MNKKFTQEYFEKRIAQVSEYSRYSNRLLDTYFFTISAAGIYFCIMFKQWVVDGNKQVSEYLLPLIYCTAALFLLVILLNLIGQAISRDMMFAEENWCREELDGLLEIETYDKKQSELYDRKVRKLSSYIVPITYAYNILFGFALLSVAIIFICA